MGNHKVRRLNMGSDLAQTCDGNRNDGLCESRALQTWSTFAEINKLASEYGQNCTAAIDILAQRELHGDATNNTPL